MTRLALALAALALLAVAVFRRREPTASAVLFDEPWGDL